MMNKNLSTGKTFLNPYYAFSPPFSDVIADHAAVRFAAQWFLLPVVGFSRLMLRFEPGTTSL
jgi:hypothetical protein